MDLHWDCNWPPIQGAPGGDELWLELPTTNNVSEVEEESGGGGRESKQQDDFGSFDSDLFFSFASPPESEIDCYCPGENETTSSSASSTNSCKKRGRRRKGTGKNKTLKKERSATTTARLHSTIQSSAHREEKNTKERTRVKNIRDQYNILREVLGHDSKKKLCKQRVLDSAISHITDLLNILKNGDHEKTGNTNSEGQQLCSTKSDLICKEDALSQSSTSSSTNNTSVAESFQTPTTLQFSPLPQSYKFNFYGQGLLSPTPFLSSPPPTAPMNNFYGNSYLHLSSPPLDLTIYRGLATPIEYNQFTPPSSYGTDPYPSSPPPLLHHMNLEN